MSYHSKIVLPGENILFIGRLHWIIYLRSIMFVLLTIAAAAGGIVINNDDLLKAGVVLAGITAVALLFAWLKRIATEIVVTDRRVIYKRGLISRRTIEMNMNKVETVDVSQSIFGRILDYGDVVIRGSGSTYEPLRKVQDPLSLRSYIIAQ